MRYHHSCNDRVEISGTDFDDRLFSTTRLARLTSSDYFAQAFGFGEVVVDLKTGVDPVIFRGDDFDQLLELTTSSAIYVVDAMRVEVANLERTTSNLGGGNDFVAIVDGSGQEIVNAMPGNVLVVGPEYSHRAYRAETAIIDSSGGADRFTLKGADSDDQVFAGLDSTRLQGDGYVIELNNFASSLILAGAGQDSIELTGSSGDDQLYLSSSLLALTGAGSSLVSQGFESISYSGGSGFDTVTLVEGSGNSLLRVDRETIELQTEGRSAVFDDVDDVIARSTVDDDVDLIEYLDADFDFLFEALGDWQ